MPTTVLSRALARQRRDLLPTMLSPAADVIDLGGDDLEGATPPDVRAAVITAMEDHECDHYTRRPGLAPLCQAVTDFLGDFGVEINPNDGVVITGGVQEARFVALRALASGKSVYLPQPGPTIPYRAAAQFAGATLHYFDPEGELPLAHEGVLVLANPNPATGQVVPGRTMDRLAAWINESDLTVVADETAAPLLRSGVLYAPFASWPGMGDVVVTLGSFAWTPGLDAWQVAWLAGPRRLTTDLRDLKQAITICSPAASQYAALAGMKQRNHDPRARDEQHVEAVCALLDRLQIPYAEPHTVAFVLADTRTLGDDAAVVAEALRYGLRLVAGSTFGMSGTIRITATGRRLHEGLDRLEQVFMALKQEPRR